MYKLCTRGLIISFDCLYTCYTKNINIAFPLLSVAVGNGANTFLYLSGLFKKEAAFVGWAWLDWKLTWLDVKTIFPES